MDALIIFALLLFQGSISGHGSVHGAGSTAAVPPATTHSLWPNSTTPTTVDSGDTSANELGVKFFADNPGYIQGLKFYKSPSNAGPHSGTLWSIGGINLGRITFAGESGSGWQTQMYATQIPVCGSTHYVASYFDVNGHFSLDRPYFTAQYDNAPLHGLADGADGGNGVYNNPTQNFPTSTFGSSNYWIDVIFTSNSAAVAVSTVSPASGMNGDTITINGCNFVSGMTATVGGASAPVAFFSSTQIQVVVPSHANGIVDVTVTASGQTATFPQSFTYANVTGPTIASISPSSGPTSGGGSMQVMGSGFAAGATVAIGGSSCTSPTFISSSQVNCTIPAGTVGFKNVVLTNPAGAGSSTCSQCYQYTGASGSLLTGCTVNSSNVPSCATPAGWTLFQAVGFDNGTMGSGVITTGISIESSKAHTGCCAVSGQYTAGDSTVSWRSALVGSTREIYVSFWEFADSTGVLNVDYDIGGGNARTAQDSPVTDALIRFQAGCGGNTGGNVAADIPFYWNAKTQRPILYVEGASGTNWPNYATWGWGAECASPNVLPGGVQGWGNWTQWEIHVKWNDPTPSNLAANGQVELFQNGVLLNQITQFQGQCSSSTPPCSNLAGINDIATAPNRAQVGGVYTKYVEYINSSLTSCAAVPNPVGQTVTDSIAGPFGTTASCKGNAPFSSTFCPNQCPPNPPGLIPLFSRYYDDVIVLKK